MFRVLLITMCFASLAAAQGKPKREKLVAEPGVWVLEGDGRTEKHACAPAEELELGGDRNVLKVTGPCKSVRIVGDKNTVTLEEVGAVNVKGSGNTVSWQRAPGGQPRQYLTGSDNTVSQFVDPKRVPKK